MQYAIENINTINPIPQEHKKATYYPKRTPEDSKLDLNKSIKDQFNILRVSDPARYPAYIINKGYRYEINIKKVGKVSE